MCRNGAQSQQSRRGQGDWTLDKRDLNTQDHNRRVAPRGAGRHEKRRNPEHGCEELKPPAKHAVTLANPPDVTRVTMARVKDGRQTFRNPLE